MKAGFFEKDVTPPVGVHLAGYPSRNEPSKGIDDPLFLRILAMEDSAGERMVLVTADLLKFPRDMAWRTKAWCEQTLGLKSASVIINLSHTHCAPGLFYQECYPQWPVDVEYVRNLELSIREGIAAALDGLKPCKMTYGIHQAHFGVSRRVPDPEREGKVKLGPNADGYYDPDMPVMAFYDEGSDNPQAVLYSYACHPTSKYGHSISADYPGEISKGLKEELGRDVHTIFVQGAGASIMPRRSNGWGTADAWRGVAGDIASFVRSDAMQELDPELRATEKEFVIPYDMGEVPSEKEFRALADPEDTPIDAAMRPANRSIVRLWAQGILEKLRTGTLAKGFRMHLTKIALSSRVQIVALSGEVTAEVGRMVKDMFPDKETIFFGYCSYTDAYIPTAKMLPEEGHEALASMYFHMRPAPFVKEIDDIIRKEVM